MGLVQARIASGKRDQSLPKIFCADMTSKAVTNDVALANIDRIYAGVGILTNRDIDATFIEFLAISAIEESILAAGDTDAGPSESLDKSQSGWRAIDEQQLNYRTRNHAVHLQGHLRWRRWTGRKGCAHAARPCGLRDWTQRLPRPENRINKRSENMNDPRLRARVIL